MSVSDNNHFERAFPMRLPSVEAFRQLRVLGQGLDLSWDGAAVGKATVRVADVTSKPRLGQDLSTLVQMFGDERRV